MVQVAFHTRVHLDVGKQVPRVEGSVLGPVVLILDMRPADPPETHTEGASNQVNGVKMGLKSPAQL